MDEVIKNLRLVLIWTYIPVAQLIHVSKHPASLSHILNAKSSVTL